MQYRSLGKAGIKLSMLGYGSWLTFGYGLMPSEVKQCIKLAYDHGINFLDNAEVYGEGMSESIMGEAIKDFRREDLVISTKIFWGGQGPNDIGLSRKHVIEGTRNSLKRLQVEYVDLLFCHRPDPNTPLEETVRAMDYLVRSGQVLYWGTSEWSAEQIEKAYKIAYELGCVPPSMEQPQYNIFHRLRVEEEYARLYECYGLGTTVWSPLASGVLTGKYNQEIPDNSRLALHPEWRSPDMNQRIEKAIALTSIADELNCSLAQLAIAWCLKNNNVSSVILGASSKEQLLENLKSISVIKNLTNEILNKIEVIAVSDIPTSTLITSSNA